MARVTVEDCIDKVPNRFELILLAAHRARNHRSRLRDRRRAGSLVSIEDVGFAAAGLAGDNARLITGGTIHVDGGLHIIG